MLNLDSFKIKELFGFEKSIKSKPINNKAAVLDIYQILGVLPTDSMEDIHDRWRRLASIYHPDKIGENPQILQINDAYNQIMKRKHL